MLLHLVREKLSALAAPPCAFHLQGSSGLVFFWMCPISREMILKRGKLIFQTVGFRSQLVPTRFGGESLPPRV